MTDNEGERPVHEQNTSTYEKVNEMVPSKVNKRKREPTATEQIIRATKSLSQLSISQISTKKMKKQKQDDEPSVQKNHNSFEMIYR